MTAEVRYSTMVYVTVDLETRTVDKVVVADETITLLGGDSDEAIEIAEDADEWPAWRFGS